MKLYDSDIAASPRRVRIFLAEKGIAVPIVKIDLREKVQFTEAFRKVNPWCTVPTLELDDGRCISEVSVICLYFEQLHPDPPLIGSSPAEQAHVLMWDRHMEQDGWDAARDAFRNAAPALKNHALAGPHDVEQIPALAERGRQRFGWFLEDLDARLARSAFVAGQRYTIADITALATIDFARRVKITDIGDYAHVRRWYEEADARSSARA
ncbi:MAG: glutathione S-transferase family protein [Rhodanobacter sp.]